jgi:hypothetical protein
MLFWSLWGCMFQKWNESSISDNEKDPETALISTGVYGVANFDDDDLNGQQDWFDNRIDLSEESSVISEENDLANFTIPAEFFEKMSGSQQLELTQKSYKQLQTGVREKEKVETKGESDAKSRR